MCSLEPLFSPGSMETVTRRYAFITTIHLYYLCRLKNAFTLPGSRTSPRGRIKYVYRDTICLLHRVSNLSILVEF